MNSKLMDKLLNFGMLCIGLAMIITATRCWDLSCSENWKITATIILGVFFIIIGWINNQGGEE